MECDSRKKLLLETTKKKERTDSMYERWKIDRRFAFMLSFALRTPQQQLFLRSTKTTRTRSGFDEFIFFYLLIKFTNVRCEKFLFADFILIFTVNRGRGNLKSCLILKSVEVAKPRNNLLLSSWKMFDFLCLYILCPWLLSTLYIVLTMLFIK